MKILKLNFSNINSLKGTFTIDFEKPELASTGLFAITGPTGAGKSTILDAITLALYCYTSRFQEITKKTIEEEKGIITRGATESHAQISFQVNGQTYLSQWSAGLTRTGNLSKIVLKVSKWEDGAFKPITDKLKDSRAEIVRIIGLSQEQFTQAIVLSQGKFDEFLRAQKADRYKLLEIITGTVLFREIGKLAFERHREIKEKIKQLSDTMGTIDVLSEADLIAMEAKIQALIAEQKDGALLLEALDNKIKTKEDIASLVATLALLEAEKSTLATEEAGLAGAMERLQDFEKTAPLMSQWNTLQSMHKDLLDENKISEEASSSLKTLFDERTGVIKTFTEKSRKVTDELGFVAALDAFFSQVDGMDKNIATLETEISISRASLVNFINTLPEKTRTILKPISSDTAKLNQYVMGQQEELRKNVLPEAFRDFDFQESINAQQNRINELNACLGLASQVEKSKYDINAITEEAVGLSNQINAMMASVQELNTSIDEESIALEALLKAVEANNAILSMEIHRQALVDGNPCPCCGSTSHPYAINLPKLNNALQENYNSRKEANEKNIGLRTEADTSIRLLERDKHNKEQNIEGINIELASRQADLKQRFQACELPETADREMVQASIKLSEENIRVIRLHQEWDIVKDSLIQFIKDMEIFQQKQLSLNNLKKERTEMFADGAISVFRDKLMQNWTKIETSISTQQNISQKASQAIEQLQEAIRKEEVAFDASMVKNGFANRASFMQSMADADTIQSTKKLIDDFKKRKDQHAGKLIQANNDLQFKQAVDDVSVTLESLLSTEKEKKELLAKNLIEQGQIQKSLETDTLNKQQHQGMLRQLELVEKEEKLYNILNNYIGDANGNKFNNIVQRITMRHLFDLANLRLESLMDRYQISLGSEDDEDSIWVVDTHMGDEWRSIDSVSGGERFVISLALALALSDMASQNVRIDSMFIDEGFGSLSPDDLYNAIAMLERMQVEGDKLVGIISHVESLKERIGTQIVVEKLQNGESTLYLKCNEQQRSLKIIGV
jgi:exonuclease SbcC